MVRLTRLRIDRFRNVRPGTDLRFGPTFNVLLGKNATGKTTLLDLIAAVTNDDLSAYAKEEAGFDLTWWLEREGEQIELHAVRKPTKIDTLLDRVREEKEFDDVWAMVLRAAGTDAGQLEVIGTHGVWKYPNQPESPFDVRVGLAEDGPFQRAIIAVAKLLNGTPQLQALYGAAFMFEPWERVGRSDEALTTMSAIIETPFKLSREDSGISETFDEWVPRDFLPAVDAQTSPDPLIVPFDKVASLATIPTLLGFASAELRPRMLKRSQDGEKVKTTYQGFDCLFTRADGSQISHELLSFGQKRLFSFLWYLAVRKTLPVVADELLNGLHHEWIEICFDRLRERQSFLATQHPFLLDHIPIESRDAVRTTFIRCSKEAGPDGREQLVWRNFDEEEAERFFVAYQTGIQQVSEVLRSEGLW